MWRWKSAYPGAFPEIHCFLSSLLPPLKDPEHPRKSSNLSPKPVPSGACAHCPRWPRRVDLSLVLQTDAELAQLDDGRSAPAGCVGREGQHERHPVLFPERLAVAEDAVVPWRRFDGQACSLESADEFANVLPHLEPTLQL